MATNRRLPHEQLVFLQTLLAGLPAIVVALWLLWAGEHTPKVQWTLSLLVIACWLGFAAAVKSRVVRPLQTMANLLSALREGDFSVRARDARRDEPLGDVMFEINTLSRTLQQQRLSALEATALLRTVMEEIEVAIFAFDQAGKLRLANHAGQLLLARPAERILGRDAAELGLADCLTGEPSRLLAHHTFPGGSGRWGLRRSVFREGGRPHHLLVIGDLSRTLREEELRAWQRLVRVLGHELNNSLAPIKSIAGSLGSLLRHEPRPADWEDDMSSGLDVIASRADGLSRFMQAYASLARLPQPTLAACAISPLLHRIAALDPRLAITVSEGPAAIVACDAAQIEQALINLLKNAVDAALEAHPPEERPAAGKVCVSWKKIPRQIEIVIEDNGPGIANAGNLFVPFFTTKSAGSGIGLVLSRQIAENHGGSLTLANHPEAPGCIARLRLPL